jgi:hypothetical protein
VPAPLRPPPTRSRPNTRRGAFDCSL